MSSSSILIEPKQGVFETSNYCWSVIKPGLSIGVWSGEQSCGTEPLSCGIWCYLWVNSIRFELNCRTSRWCWRIAWCGKGPTTHWKRSQKFTCIKNKSGYLDGREVWGRMNTCTWVWVNSSSWWWTGRPGVLQFMGSQSRTQLSDWTEYMCMCGWVPSLFTWNYHNTVC